MTVIRPGVFSTFQDLGRTGWQHLGVPVSGVMDEVSHRIANLLVGNDEREATLEITMTGPSLSFDHDALIALAGADLGAQIVSGPGGQTTMLAPCTPMLVGKGAVVQFAARRTGLRAWLAVEGGFGLDHVMGSCSTHVRSAMGGHRGRALRKGDVLQIPGTMPNIEAMRIDPRAAKAVRALSDDGSGLVDRPVRAMKGREWSSFTEAARAAFFDATWKVGGQSDRMGYRLEAADAGVRLQRDAETEMVSEAVAFGTVQVPSDGLPIVLMADRQSTGGYPRIAQVATVDLPRLAQAAPGESLRFELIGMREAELLLLRRERDLQSLRKALSERRNPS